MDICQRLIELSNAAADNNWREFSMRVPADESRDADLVLLRAAKLIDHLRAENQALREALECIAGGEIYPREVARDALAAKGEGK